MEIVRTTKTRLDWDVTTAQRTVEAWLAACNGISQRAFAQGCLSNAVYLHRLVYSDIRYKADTFGMEVLGIDPRHTSQGCSRCGHTEKANRHRFLCKACGYGLHADLNASRNIRLRGVLARQVLYEDAPLSWVA